MNESQPTLGQLVEFDRPRDAVHVAIIPLVAAEELHPGWMVGADKEGYAFKVDQRHESIGVVDPFLYGVVPKGKRCWVLLTPDTVTGMRHQWTTADFPEEGPPSTREMRAAATAWLMKFADDKNIRYDDMVAGAVSGEGATFGVDCHGSLAQEFGEGLAQQFWEHLEVVTGRRFPAAHRSGTHFSCTC